MILIIGVTGTNVLEIVKSAVTSVVADLPKKKPISFDEFAREQASYFRGPAT
jgi:hypothetical protein